MHSSTTLHAWRQDRRAQRGRPGKLHPKLRRDEQTEYIVVWCNWLARDTLTVGDQVRILAPQQSDTTI